MLTTGAPAAIASINDTGMPSRSPFGAIRLGSVKIVAARSAAPHLRLGARADQRHQLGEPLTIDASLELALQRPLADDLTADAAPPPSELGQGVDEDVESLDRIQPADGDDQILLAPVVVKGEAGQVDAAVNDGHPIARLPGHLLGEPRDVVARDRDRHRRRFDLLPQQVIVNEDVVGVTGEAERLADETRQRQRRRRRIAGPVGVDDVGIELPRPSRAAPPRGPRPPATSPARSGAVRARGRARSASDASARGCARSAAARRRAAGPGDSGCRTRGRSRSASGCTNVSDGAFSERMRTSAPAAINAAISRTMKVSDQQGNSETT